MEEEGKSQGWERRSWRKGSRVGWRIGASIISFFGLLIFVIIWLFFYADGYSIYQNLAILLVAILAFMGVNGAAWASIWMRL